MSVSGTLFSGPISFLCKVTFQSAATEVWEKDVCLGAGLLKHKGKGAEDLPERPMIQIILDPLL